MKWGLNSPLFSFIQEDKDMKKVLFSIFAMVLSFGVMADTVLEDIQQQGKESYLAKTITNQQLADMIRDHEALTAANTLTYAECGKTVFLNSATEFATTLPSPVAGCTFSFYIKAAPVGSSYTVVAGSNVIYGQATVNGAAVAAVTENTITFTAGAAAIGDFVDLVSDGTNWYVSGQGVAATAIAFTAP